MLKPIETKYDGRFFRSRAEARWAVFFSQLGVVYEHEPEGFELPSGRWYLPDFRVRYVSGGKEKRLWIEVKPSGRADDFKMSELARMLDRSTDEAIMLSTVEDYRDTLHSSFLQMNLTPLVGGDEYYAFCVCPDCGAFGFEFEGRSARIKCCAQPTGDGHGDKNRSYDNPRILMALSAAMSARFAT